MQAAGRRCGRQTLCAVYQGLRPFAPARGFSSSTISQDDNADASRKEPALADEPYSNVPINPDNKTVESAVGELPLSPLMDPGFHDARLKYTKPKPLRSGYKLTKFQRQLRRNPYAQALATPVRRCTITSTTLPNFFLQPFNLLSHPETGEPWFVPTGFETKVPNTAADTPEDAPEDAPAMTRPEPGTDNALQEPPEPSVGTAAPEPPGTAAPETEETAEQPSEARESSKTGPSAYVLSRQRLFQELRNPQSVYFNAHKRLLRTSDHGQSTLGAVISAAHWRPDMDSFLLELMRRRVVEGLVHFARLVEEVDRAYVVRCELWNDVRALKHRGCLLYLGPPDGAPAGEGYDYVPPRLSKMDAGGAWFGRVLVVHNLRMLLGDEHLKRLREESMLFRDGSLYLLGRQATVKLQMLLWRLQGYVAWEEPAASETNGTSE